MAKKPGKWLSSIFGGGKGGGGPVPAGPSERPGDEAAPDPAVTMPAPGPKDAAAIQAEEEKVPLEWRVGNVILDLYEVKHIHKGGGMGLVYRVHHRGWDMDLAVKSPRAQYFQTEAHKENFARECESWINLGLHPNMVSCHYVRTLGGIPRVFAEYVEGGSLQEWIKDRRLYEGGHDAALERMLDVAIQFAWGLQYAHDQGLVHQDVKPANVLMGKEGAAKVKVTDFGLARARAATDESSVLGPGQSPLVTTQGNTPAYRSPEQAHQEGLTHKTDIWSWAVSVLEMFNGEVTWPAGEVASEVLDSHLESGPVDASIPKMPEALVELLRRCFARNPDGRPEDMHEIVRILTQIYADPDSYEDKGEEKREYVRVEPKAAELLADGLNNRAVSLLDLGKQEQAEKLWEEALANHPNHPESTYNRGLVSWRSGLISDFRLVRQLQSVLGSYSDHWRAHHLLAQVHLERDDCEAAITHLERAQELDPHNQIIPRALVAAQQQVTASRRQLATLRAHESEITCLCFSADGEYALSASRDAVKLWHIPTGRCAQIFEAALLGINSITFLALSYDGRWCLCAAWVGDRNEESYELLVLDTSTGTCIRRMHTGYSSGCGGLEVCLTRDGRFGIATSDALSTTFAIWDLTTGETLRQFKHGEWVPRIPGILALCLSEDDRLILSAGGDGTLKLWDMNTGRCVRTLPGESKWTLHSACMNANATHALVSKDSLELVDLRGGRGTMLFDTQLYPHTRRIHLSANAHWAIAGGVSLSKLDEQVARHPLMLWDVTTGRCVRTLQTDAHITAVAMSPDGQHALCGHKDGIVTLWRLPCRDRWTPSALAVALPQEGQLALRHEAAYKGALRRAEERLAERDAIGSKAAITAARSLPGHDRHERAVHAWAELYRWLPKRRLRAAWPMAQLEIPKVTLGGSAERGPVEPSTLGADARYALTTLWEVRSGRVLRAFADSTVSGRCLRDDSVAFSGDGRLAAFGYGEGRVRVWHVASGRRVCVLKDCLPENSRRCVRTVSMSADGRFTVSGEGVRNHWNSDASVLVWDTVTGRRLRRFGGHNGWAHVPHISADGRFILTTDWQGSLRLWSIATGICRKVLQPEDTVECAVLTADTRRVLVSDRKRFFLWDIIEARCERTYDASSVNSIALSTDGRWALTGGGGWGSPSCLWDVNTGARVRTFEGHEGSNVVAVLSADARYALLTKGWDSATIWFLDWELEEKTPVDWDEGARPQLVNFLTLHTPYVGQLPKDRTLTDGEVTLALTRKGKPSWTDEEFKQLLYTLGCAGYGWLRPEGVKRELEKMAADWDGPPPLVDES